MRRTSLSAVLGLLSTLAVGLVGTAAPAVAEEVLERPATGAWAVEGRGWGHGRGLSQWGAQGAASVGVGAEQIVSTYYPGTAREVLPAAPISILPLWPTTSQAPAHVPMSTRPLAVRTSIDWAWSMVT